MFYLIRFYELLKNNPIKGAFYFLSSFGLFLAILNFSVLDKKVAQYLENEKPYPYFTALVTGNVSASQLKRNLISLPGVRNVELKSNQKVNEQAKKIVNELGLNGNSFVKNRKLYALKLNLDRQITKKREQLIKEYISRKVGNKNVDFSPLRTPQGPFLTRDKAVYNFLKQYTATVIIFTLFVLWILGQALIYQQLMKTSYLIEEYQRKKFVSIKIHNAGLLSIFFVLTLASTAFQAINLFWAMTLFVFLILQSTFYLKKWNWNE